MQVPKSTKVRDLHESIDPMHTLLVDVMPDGNGPFFVHGEFDGNSFRMEKAWDEIIDGYPRDISLTVLFGYGIEAAITDWLIEHFREKKEDQLEY